MNDKLRNTTLAIAGVFQAVALVRDTAHEGRCDKEAFDTTINSLFITEPENTEAVYGGIGNLRLGLNTLIAQIAPTDKKPDADLTRYALSAVILTRKLMKKKDSMDTLVNGIERARSQSEHFDDPLHENVIANLADIYVNTVSTLQPRIIVNGAHGHLSHAHIANRVRALLLAAIRSVVLWQQCGGSRWQLLFKRRAIANEAQQLLAAV